MRDAEVIVVGGSLGGTAVASHLALRGHEVLVLDRDTFPREKVCGEGLMPYGVSELVRLGLRDALVDEVQAQPFIGIGYQVGTERAMGLFPAGYRGLGVRRGRLDRAFSDLVEVPRQEGCRVTGISGRPGAMEVNTTMGVKRCSVVIGADGMRSGVRKALGLDVPRRGRARYGLRGHLELPARARQLETVEVVVGQGLEFYLTPVGKREINVAVLLEKHSTKILKGDLAGGFARILQAPELEWLAGARQLSEPMLTGPLRHESRDVVADGALLVGDAAGFLDGITGEGMSLTLLSARLAAEVLSPVLRSGSPTASLLRPYAVRRRRASRDLTLLTVIVLGGIRNRWLAKRVVAGLGRHPRIFERVLAVNTGVGSLRDVGLQGLWRILLH